MLMSGETFVVYAKSLPSLHSIKTLGAATMPVCLLPHTQRLAVCAAQRGWPGFEN